MKKVLKRMLPKSRIGRSVLALMSGTAMAQLITAASMPIVTRLYTPEMIGVISVYLAFFNFWLTILTWRYESALLVTENEEESHHVFRLGALLAFATALIAIPTLAGLQYIGILGFEILPIWAPLIVFFSLLGFGWFMLYRCWLLRLGHVRVISISTIARSGSNAVTRVLAGGFGLGAPGLFLAEIIGSWAALGAVRTKTRRLLKFKEPEWRMHDLKKAAIRYKKFAKYEMPSSVINQLAVALPVPMVGAIYGAQAAGWFGMARLLYAIPNRQIGRAVGDVFQMELGRCVREGKIEQGRKLFYKFSVRLLLVGLIPFFAAILLAPSLVPFIFGDDWSAMGEVVARMAPWMLAVLVVSSMSRALSVLEQQEKKLIFDLLALSVVLTLYFFKSEGLNFLAFIDILAYGMTISYLLYFLIIMISFR